MTSTEPVRARVESLLRSHGLTTPPVPVEKIAKALGVQVQGVPFDDDLSGLIYIDGKKPIIAVNSRHHLNRRRFTIAHELGHFVLHKEALAGQIHVDRGFRVLMRDGTSASGTDGREIEANQFAAELLMPKSFVLTEVRRKKTRSPDETTPLLAIAKRFQVSEQALQFRMLNLGLVPIGL